MTKVITNKPFIASCMVLLVWLITSLFVVLPVHLSTILVSVCLVYIGSYLSIFTKKVREGKGM